MPPPTLHQSQNPLFPQTKRLFSLSPLILIGARKMSEQQIPPQATEATAVPAPVPNGTSAEDVEMADPAPVAATAPENTPVEGQAQSIVPEVPIAIAPEPQAQPIQQQQQPTQPASAPISAPSPAPVPTSTRNSPHPSGPTQMPVHAMLHGAPHRQYLNQHVTPHLLEAMKHLVTAE